MAGKLTFGELLKRYRKAAGVTQDALAARTGYSTIYIGMLERGERRPVAAAVTLLTRALGLTAADRAALGEAETRLSAPSSPPGATAPASSPPGGAPMAVPPLTSSPPDAFAPPDATPSPMLSSLPIAPTELVGREHAVAAAVTLLGRDGARLLTLTGPGGVGKTRLALAVAEEARDRYPDGVVFVPLAAVTHPGLVAPAVAGALGVRETGGQPLLANLITSLGDKTLLLLLDNVEQVVAAAPFVGELLSACPGLTVLATSREALRLRAEHLFPVPPLALPAPGEGAAARHLSAYGPDPSGRQRQCTDSGEGADLVALERVAAVALFVQRARQVQPAFALTRENAPAVVAICARLEGLPLAIELAAARVKVLPPAALLARLERRLPLLASGARDLPARQRTMRDAIAWSHDLLDTDEQRLFQRLAVFAGGWTLEAAEAVCNRDGGLPLDMLDGLASLIDKSMVRQEAHGDGGDGESRFRMLETVREYGLERLALAGDEDDARASHAAYYLALVERAEPELTGAEQPRWMERLEGEHDNVRAALRWARDHDSVALLRLVAVLWWFWALRGHVREGVEWLTIALAVPGSANPVAALARARVLTGLGNFAREAQGDYARATALHEEALALFRAHDDRRGVANTLYCLGYVLLRQNCYARGEGLLRESVALSRETGDRWQWAMSLHFLAYANLHQGHYPSATALFEQSLALQGELRDARGTALGLWGAGLVAQHEGAYARATDLYERSQSLLRGLGEDFALGRVLRGLGEVAWCQGDLARAQALLGESLTMRRTLGDAWGEALSLQSLAAVVLGRGDDAEATALYGESTAIFAAIGDRLGLAQNLEGTAHVARARGRDVEAARLLGAAAAARDAMSTPLPPADRPTYDETLAGLRATLGEQDFAAAWAEGSTLSLEQAVAMATANGSG